MKLPVVHIDLVALLRPGATLFAILAGTLHIAALWSTPLSASALWEAGRGSLLLLISLGLVGVSQLSLGLAILVGGLGLVGWLEGQPWRLVSALEMALVLFAAMSLVSPYFQDPQ